MYKLGIDVGGTNTDAVLIDENLQVIAEAKYPTSQCGKNCFGTIRGQPCGNRTGHAGNHPVYERHR